MDEDEDEDEVEVEVEHEVEVAMEVCCYGGQAGSSTQTSPNIKSAFACVGKVIN